MLPEIPLDELELRVQLAEAVDEALDIAGKLAIACIDGPVSVSLVASLARDYQEKRLRVHSLRRALVVECGG